MSETPGDGMYGPRLFQAEPTAAGAAPPGRRDVVEATAEVVRLRELLTDVGDVDPVSLPEGQALADARELIAARAQLDRVLLRRLGDVDARKLHRLDASPTTTAWVRAQDGSVDGSTVTLARRLNRLPGVEQALREGTLSTRVAELLGAALAKLRPLVDRPDLETGGQCQGAGCCRGPGSILIPHHVDPWHRSHSTSLKDTVLLCEADHAALHRGQTITLKDGRQLNANGWVR